MVGTSGAGAGYQTRRIGKCMDVECHCEGGLMVKGVRLGLFQELKQDA